MNSHERDALDRHITGNLGEDQFPAHRNYPAPAAAIDIIESKNTSDELVIYLDKVAGEYDISIFGSWEAEAIRIQCFLEILESAIGRWEEIQALEEKHLG